MLYDYDSLLSLFTEFEEEFLDATTEAEEIDAIRSLALPLAERIDLSLKACDPDCPMEFDFDCEEDAAGNYVASAEAIEVRTQFLSLFGELMELAWAPVLQHIQRSHGAGGFLWNGVGNLHLKEVGDFWQGLQDEDHPAVSTDCEQSRFLKEWLNDIRTDPEYFEKIQIHTNGIENRETKQQIARHILTVFSEKAQKQRAYQYLVRAGLI